MTNWKDVQQHSEEHVNFNRIPEGFTLVPVVGVTFVKGYPQNILNLKNTGDNSVVLVRNPNNPYDSNAIEVHFQGSMLGHIPKDIAALVAPLLDAGNDFFSSIYQVRVSPENPNNPGLDILLEDWTQ